MPPSAISRLSFVEQAYQAIKQRIVGGDFGPGTQLNIDALARQLGVSNSPVREALRRLENERWVETIPFRGAFVRPLDPVELAGLYELRGMLELAALRKVMPRPPAEGLGQLEKALAELRAAVRRSDPLAYLAADTRFHQAIVDMARNKRLSEMYATLVEQGKCFMLGRGPESMARYRKGRDQHGAIFDAVRRGDGKRAVRLLEEHLRIGPEDAPVQTRKK
ncbi:MAG TPA: GntR family transcriptional regulator [Phycisphaerae bacterium]|nr:GntR family transcriptional regulator [Phycisphaerae bacterium]HRR84550.1 GntR family transcriptional regulator [Phycisphaerae bacterium]